MTLYAKVLMVVLIPLAAFTVFGTFRLQNVINHYESAIHENHQLKATGIRQSLGRRTAQLKTAVAVLSESVEISRALQKADNDILYDFSHRFIGPVDAITFTDSHGVVISRAHDEFRFGDDISTTHYYEETHRNGNFQGFSNVDNRWSIIVSSVIKKYDDLPIGAVFVSITLSQAFLKSLAGSEQLILEVTDGSFSILSSISDEPYIHTENLTGLFEKNSLRDISLQVHFREDKNFTNLVQLKESIYIGSALMYGVFVVILLIFLRHHLKPISLIVEHILSFAGQQLNTKSLKNKLNLVHKNTNTTGQKITAAIIQLLNTIEINIKEREAVNESLNNSIKELELSLSEIKTLRGLLPMCAKCKKIRDDSGYWNNLEQYVEQHSEASFSHGVCPDCAEELYGKQPWFQKYREKQKDF